MRRWLVSLLVVALAPGCALPFRGTTTEVTIHCTNVPGATLRVDGVIVQPGTLELKRGDDHTVYAEAPGYRQMHTTIKSEAAYGWLIPEAIFAFISVWLSVPLCIDAISGALFDLEPNVLELTLMPDDDAPVGTQPATPANGRPDAEPDSRAPTALPPRQGD